MDTTINPLMLPEIRAQISKLVSVKDAVACTQVCLDWTDEFAYRVWETVDFEVHTFFPVMDRTVIARHGHRIRVVENLRETFELISIHVPSVCKLTRLSITLSTGTAFMACAYDFLRRNNATLRELDISTFGPDKTSALFFPLDALSPGPMGSKISELQIQGLAMTRDSFSALLRSCPLLQELDVAGLILYSGLAPDIYQHKSLKYLHADINHVFQLDPTTPNAISLLAHFPMLTEWETEIPADSDMIPSQFLREQVGRYCPLLKSVVMDASPQHSSQLLLNGFEHLTDICLVYDWIESEVIMAILAHQTTLEEISVYDADEVVDNSYEAPPMDDHLRQQGWMFQMIPRLCSQLTTISFPLHEMDMDEVEKTRWICANLEVLHVRIRGLDSREAIKRAYQLWTDGRNARKRKNEKSNVVRRKSPRTKQGVLQRGAGSDDAPADIIALETDNSIEARAARHLLHFEKLRELWLGVVP